MQRSVKTAVVPSLRGIDTFPTTHLVAFVPVVPDLIEIATLDTPICRSFFFSFTD